MAETLFGLTLALAREIEKGGLYEGATTVGGVGTDLTLTDATNPLTAGVLNGGTLWITTGLRAGQSRIITSHAAGGILVWTPALSGGTLAVGDQYAAFGPEFPRDLLRRAVNTALRNLPPFARYNVATLTVANQEDYDLPASVENIRSLEVANLVYDALDPAKSLHYMRHTGWTEITQTEGLAAPAPAIRFWKYPPAVDGYRIRLGYNVIHPVLTADAEFINDGVSPPRLIYEALAEAWLKRIRPRDSQALDEQAQVMYNRAVAMAKMMPRHHINTLPQPIFIAGVGSRGAGTVNPDLVP